MPSPQSSSLPKKLGRKQVLNVIYFIDSSKTHSFKLSILAFRGVLAGLAFLLVWSVASILTIAVLVNSQTKNQDRIRKYLSTVFEYQVRHDSVFERAYPDGRPPQEKSPPLIAARTTPEKTALAAKTAPSAEKTKEIAKPVIHSEPAKVAVPVSIVEHTEDAIGDEDSGDIESGEEINIPSIGASTSEESQVAGAQVASSQAPPSVPAENTISVENAHASFTAFGMVLDFAIRNSNNPTTAEGHFWGVAKFLGNDGSVHYVGAPRAIQAQSDGTVLAPKASFIFRIRNYKTQNMDFANPSGVAGQFTEVEIVLLNAVGGQKSFKIPVQGKIVGARSLSSPANTQGTANDQTQKPITPSSTARLDGDGL